MKITNIKQIDEFLATVRRCTGDVWLESVDGDKINLRSRLSQYVAIGALLGAEGDKLELFCAKQEDEALFLNYFGAFPETA